MMNLFKTPQESFWAGKFGDEYIKRNMSMELLASNLSLFSSVLEGTENINSVLEFGCNIGMNIKAIKLLLPNVEFVGVEINEAAALVASKIDNVKIHNQSLLNFQPDNTFDLVFTKGVLIHVSPDELSKVYAKLADASSRYVLIAEYYNPTPVSIDYRGNKDRLFKRDFAGEFLDVNNDFRLVSYKFHYKRSFNFAQDDITWFLMERR